MTWTSPSIPLKQLQLHRRHTRRIVLVEPEAEPLQGLLGALDRASAARRRVHRVRGLLGREAEADDVKRRGPRVRLGGTRGGSLSLQSFGVFGAI